MFIPLNSANTRINNTKQRKPSSRQRKKFTDHIAKTTSTEMIHLEKSFLFDSHKCQPKLKSITVHKKPACSIHLLACSTVGVCSASEPMPSSLFLSGTPRHQPQYLFDLFYKRLQSPHPSLCPTNWLQSCISLCFVLPVAVDWWRI
ncbi:hypothetical protein HanRHA438_Chr14g0669831 [Helianthus annuus]|nr:hypothetical protein HanRHA438_Chr14g0669831 [Helianthus annuus]